MYPDSPNVYDSLVDGVEADGQMHLAIKNLGKTIEKLKKSDNMDEEREQSIERTLLEKKKRLKKE